jgi:hypothetical protein
VKPLSRLPNFGMRQSERDLWSLSIYNHLEEIFVWLMNCIFMAPWSDILEQEKST